jgi:hypothetical protein
MDLHYIVKSNDAAGVKPPLISDIRYGDSQTPRKHTKLQREFKVSRASEKTRKQEQNKNKQKRQRRTQDSETNLNPVFTQVRQIDMITSALTWALGNDATRREAIMSKVAGMLRIGDL